MHILFHNLYTHTHMLATVIFRAQTLALFTVQIVIQTPRSLNSFLLYIMDKNFFPTFYRCKIFVMRHEIAVLMMPRMPIFGDINIFRVSNKEKSYQISSFLDEHEKK